MSKKPYHYVIQDNGDWAYFVRGKPVDIYDYRRAVELHTHAERKQAEAERDERLAHARGVHISTGFQTVYSKQLAQSPQHYYRKDPSCGYSSYKELEQKAKATGQAVNVWSQSNDQ